MRWWLIAWRNVVRDAGRSLSTVFIIAVGLAALLLGIGFMLSSYDGLQEIAKRVEGHVVILEEGEETGVGSHQQLNFKKWREVTDSLWEDERVLRVLPRAKFEGTIQHRNFSAVVFGKGVDAKDEFRVYGPFLRTDGALDPWLGPNDMPDVMLGRYLAKTLNADIGDVLQLHVMDRNSKIQPVSLRLAGTYHTGNPEIDNHSIIVNLNTVNQLIKTENVTLLAVYLNDVNDAKAVQTSIQQQWPELSIQRWDNRAELHDKVKSQYDRIFSVMGLIILVVVFLAISNTIALAVHQRREEIATLGALGTRPARIYLNFIQEALIIGTIASILGIAIAYGLANTINSAELMMPAPPGRTEGYAIYVYVSWPHYFFASGVLIATAVIASSIAVLKAGRVSISEAMSA